MVSRDRKKPRSMIFWFSECPGSVTSSKIYDSSFPAPLRNSAMLLPLWVVASSCWTKLLLPWSQDIFFLILGINCVAYNFLYHSESMETSHSYSTRLTLCVLLLAALFMTHYLHIPSFPSIYWDGFGHPLATMNITLRIWDFCCTFRALVRCSMEKSLIFRLSVVKWNLVSSTCTTVIISRKHPWQTWMWSKTE